MNEGAGERVVGDMIARASTLLAGVDRATVAVSDAGAEGLRLVGAYGLTADYVEHLNSDRPLHVHVGDEEGSGPAIRGFRSGRSVAIPDVTEDPAFEPWRQIAAAEGFRSVLAVPLIASGAPLGVLTCYCDDPGQIERSQSELIEALASHAGVVLEGFQLRRTQERTIAELSSALEEMRRHRTLHAELMSLALRGADDEEILDVAGKVLRADLARTSSPTPLEQSRGVAVGAGDVTTWLVPDRDWRGPTARTVQLIIKIRKQLTESGMDAGPDTIVRHLQHHHDVTISPATVSRLARQNLVTPSRRSDPSPPTSGSKPSNPTRPGSPTSSTCDSPLAARRTGDPGGRRARRARSRAKER